MDLRQVMNTPTKAQDSATPVGKRKASSPAQEQSQKVAKPNQDFPQAVYVLLSKQTGKHSEPEFHTHGVYSCMMTAMSRADRMVSDGGFYSLLSLAFLDYGRRRREQLSRRVRTDSPLISWEAFLVLLYDGQIFGEGSLGGDTCSERYRCKFRRRRGGQWRGRELVFEEPLPAILIYVLDLLHPPRL